MDRGRWRSGPLVMAAESAVLMFLFIERDAPVPAACKLLPDAELNDGDRGTVAGGGAADLRCFRPRACFIDLCKRAGLSGVVKSVYFSTLFRVACLVSRQVSGEPRSGWGVLRIRPAVLPRQRAGSEADLAHGGRLPLARSGDGGAAFTPLILTGPCCVHCGHTARTPGGQT
jgi:hypothetical protein